MFDNEAMRTYREHNGLASGLSTASRYRCRMHGIEAPHVPPTLRY
jgi:hypothetical protein